jgi:desulfoferrodoxin-like iron-binding protein
MNKRGFGFLVVLVVALAVALTVAGCKKAPEKAAETTMQKATPAPAQEEYTQEKPYTAEFLGPWTEEVAKKHVPEITYEKTEGGLKVTVKIDNHPMDPQAPHYIMWIKLEDGDGNVLGQKDFVATDPAPATATFDLMSVPAKLKATERCNVHGIWMSETDVMLP